MRERFLSFAMVVGIGFLLLVSLVVSAWLAAVSGYVGRLLPAPAGRSNRELRHLLRRDHRLVRLDLQAPARREDRLARCLAGRRGHLACSPRQAPHRPLPGKERAWLGFGAAGSLVVIVVWVYYSAQILLLGAEFTKVWTERRGSGFKVEKTAKPVTAEARAEQGMGPKRTA